MFVTLTACASANSVEIDPFIDNSKADGQRMKLHYSDRHRLDVDDPSDLASLDGKLYTVSDKHSKVYRIEPGGDTSDTLDIEGSDLEALAFDAGGRLFVVEESSATIWRIDGDGGRHAPFVIADAADGNSGLEGLAFADEGHLFAAKEKDPPTIYELDADFGELDRVRIDFADDLSALAFDPEDGRLYALSDEDHALFRLDRDLDVDKAWRLPIDKPEGIAFDGDMLYVVSDSEDRLHVFEIERD